MRSFPAFLFILCVCSTTALAGGAHRGPPPIEPLIEELQLSDEQAAEFMNIMELHHEQAQQLGGREARGSEEMQVLRAQTDAELQTVLTADQFEQLQELRQARQKRGRHKGRGRQSPDPSSEQSS